MNTGNRDFDKEAAAWDENPARVKLANDIARAITGQVALTPALKVMDFGCGTGLLTLQLQPLVRSITGVDSSQGMLDIFKTKISKLKLNNVSAVLAAPGWSDALAGHYDLVVSNMTLHHIREIEPLLEQFHRVTASGGHLCLADLDLDDGQFHDDNTGVFHFGFDRPALRKSFINGGFDQVRDVTAAEVVKPANSGAMRRFTVFLMTGRKTTGK
jgi:ubiquinone/menaquinone biosynthesis C-methylase UbiE